MNAIERRIESEKQSEDVYRNVDYQIASPAPKSLIAKNHVLLECNEACEDGDVHVNLGRLDCVNKDK